MTFKNVVVGFSIFAAIYGLETCETFSFMSGYFAGAAAVVTYMIWEEEDDET